MRRAILVCLLALACRTVPATPAVKRVHGSLVLHLGETAPPTTRVLLGDGSKFSASPDSKGDLHFADANLEGPQDVTILLVDQGSSFAFTMTDVDVEELRLDFEDILHELNPREIEHRTTTVEGRVTGFIGPEVFVTVFGPGLVTGGFITTRKEGAFASTLFGDSIPPTAQFVALETEKPFAQQVVRLGAVPDVALPLAAPLTIPLTHTLTEAVTIDVDGLETYGGHATAITALEPVPGQRLGLRREQLAARTPVLFPARTGAFANWPRQVVVNAGDALESGAAEITRQVDESAIHLRLPKAPKLLAPVLEAKQTPALQADGLTFRWQADRSTTVQSLVLGWAGQDEVPLAWLVVMPSERHEFKPFPLPGHPLRGVVEMELLSGRSPRSWDELVQDGLFVNFDRALVEHASIRRFFTVTPRADK